MNDGNPVTFTPTNDPASEGDVIESCAPMTMNAYNKREPAQPMEDWEYYF